VGDFNSDTHFDIVVANYLSNSVGILLGLGDGSFAAVILFQMDYESHPFFVLANDLNNDGKLDFAVANNICSLKCFPSLYTVQRKMYCSNIRILIEVSRS
jgi:hypothetical protein